MGRSRASMRMAFSVMWAFAARGMATYASYRAKLLLTLASVVLSVVTFAFVGDVVARAGTGFEERYGMSYSSFVLLGLLIHGVATAGLHSFRTSIRREQLQGTLELLLSTRLPLPAAVILSGLCEVLAVTAGGVLVVLIAILVFGIEFSVTSALVAAAALYTLSMCGVGLASAGVILVAKEGDPVSWIFGTLSGILGGVYFPIDLLPAWIRSFSAFLPTTHALALARSGLTPTGGARSLLVLAFCAAVSLPVGLLILRWGYERARSSGSLGEY